MFLFHATTSRIQVMYGLDTDKFLIHKSPQVRHLHKLGG